MSTKRIALLAAAVMAVGLIVGGVLPSAAQQAPPPIAAEVLTGRAVFPDDVDLMIKRKLSGGHPEIVKTEDPSRTVTARFTVQPGAQFPWHTHAGPVIVNVVAGTLVYVGADDCTEHAYPAGTAFVDLGHGDVHSAFNPSGSDVTVLVATFLEAPESGDLLIPAEAPAGCVLTP
jgi:quercetin dioxygenase-like cupin family protein